MLAFTALQQVPPKGATPTQEAPGGGGSAPQAAPPGGSSLIMFLPLLLLVPFLLLSFRRQKKEQEARGKLKKGDRVMSQSGLIGELVDLDERFAKVKIAPGTTVQMLASTVSPLEAATTETKTDDKLKDLKDAKAGAAEKK
jgi:preprotein translocase subunit YajC